ncbi:MAG: hypothetical protein BGP06_18750 [Rhizobiales bacterium 65-9]|nr:hypothetical protein [Hyphomicrobiales bacterium]OJY35029.1 MAG: hypothetical protein BGP06_18750 [Rhizobiales bacterium 65-9]
MSFFRFRTPEREEQADAARFDAVEKPLRSELRKTEKELAGLRQRLVLAREQIAAAGGAKDDRQRHDAFLDEAGRRLLRAEQRVSQLSLQADCFREMATRFDRLRADLAQSRPSAR